MFPLLMADRLGDFIVGTAVETIETERLISEFEEVIITDVYENDKPVDSVVNNLQDYIQSKGIQLNTVVMEDVYADSEVASRNVSAWLSAKNIAAASSSIATVSHSSQYVLKPLHIMLFYRSPNLALKPNSK